MGQPRARVLERHLSSLQDVLVARRRQLGLRIGMTMVIGLSCVHTVGWAIALAWIGAYLGLQLFETVRMRQPRSALLILAVLHLNSWVFGAFAL
ncbi:MAG TPA: hypothetical protein VF495_22065, partial [Phenylobacterium sp.]